jgi:oligopeptide transport system substrate-binding protein
MVDAGNRPAWGLLPPELANGTDYRPVWATWPRAKRLALAQSLLKAAGFGIERPLRFQIRFNSSADHRKAAVAMATMWRDLGVEAELLNSEASLHFDSLKRADFQMARSGWIADLPAAENFLSVHRGSAGVQNYSGFNDPRFDKALDTALAETDAKLRTAKMQIAEQILMEEAAILPLYFYTSRALVSPRVTGWIDNAAHVHPSRTLGIQ